MPGIVGLITARPGNWAEEQLQMMLREMRHQPCYVSGTWSDASTGVYAGWVARPGSFSSEMPIRSFRGDKVLVFSGEEYSGKETRARLKANGRQVQEAGVSYLVDMAEEDERFPQSLNGKFHGILVDRSSGTAILFNDRYGMHRLYFYQSAETLYFAAEAKAILKVKPEARCADPRALGEFVACGCVLEDRTIFRDIHLLPAGSAWQFRNGIVERRGKYFEPSEWENQSSLDSSSYYQQLRSVFSDALPRYFDGQEKVAISLTGGLDTRMIMAWTKAAPGSLPGYTFGGPYRECHDVKIARKVARVCHQPHQVIPIGDEFLSRFPHYAERAVYLTDGCTNVSRAADLYANEIAAKIAPVRMTGNYGSEVLRRLRAFKPLDPTPGLYAPEFVSWIEKAKETYAGLLRGHALTFIAFRQAPWYQYGLLALEQTQLAVRSPFLDNDLVATAFRAPQSEIVKTDIFEDSDECRRLIADGNPALRRIPTDRGLSGNGGVIEPMRRGLLEFTFRAEYAYDYGMPQWLARVDHSLSALHLERLFLGRHKFCHYRVWYRDKLSNYVREMLLDSRTLSRPFLERKAMEKMVRDHLEGRANHTSDIHRLLTLELQHRLFIDAI